MGFFSWTNKKKETLADSTNSCFCAYNRICQKPSPNGNSSTQNQQKFILWGSQSRFFDVGTVQR